MKQLFIFLMLVLATVNYANAQQVTSEKITNNDLVYILNHLTKVTEYTNDDLYITVYKVSDPSGSAKLEDCEITEKIYIAVSEDGEFPEQHLYKLSSVYSPTFVKWIKSAHEPKLIFNYLDKEKKKTAIVKITLRKVVIQNV